MHLKLLDQFDLAALETLAPDLLRQEIATMVDAAAAGGAGGDQRRRTRAR